MSRIGKLPVAVPAGVEVKIGEENLLTVKGPKGTLERKLSADMHIAMEDGQIVVTRPNDLKRNKALHGLTRTLIFNMIVGVTQGYEKTLEINGVGYIHFCKAHNACYNLASNHKRRNAVGKSTVNHKISCIGNNC